MPRVIVPIFFDYASTLCYVAWRIVRELEPELGFDALWKGVPIARRDRGASAGRAMGPNERQKILNVIAETGIQVSPPAQWIDSGAALEGSELARESGAFRAYHESVFRAAFEEHRDIADVTLLCEIAAQSGIAPLWFGEHLAAHDMAPRIEQNKREADEFSALGYPTFILGDFPLTGIQPIETMRMLLKRFIRQRLAEPQA
ncbi:MAG TPA: DsbA family protein [Candidatus Binataceae bacterium]|nr:DsbA family protein [Candidatus Binataceae bacterium]